MDLNIIYEDEFLLVLNKPAGYPIHPSMLHFEDSISNGVKYYFADNKSAKGLMDIALVQKMDSSLDDAALVDIARRRFASAAFRGLPIETFLSRNGILPGEKGYVEAEPGSIHYHFTGLASSRPEARQLVVHNHFTVNGKKVNVSSYLVKAGDVVTYTITVTNDGNITLHNIAISDEMDGGRKVELSTTSIDKLEVGKNAIVTGTYTVTQEDIDAVTEPLGETVMQVYGWTFDTPEHIPIKGRPVGRIEFLGSNGAVCESIEYYDEERMTNAILTENYYGSPMNVVLYRDKDGKNISQDFVEKLDPPNIGFKVTDIPGALSKDGGIKGMGGML